MLRLGRESFGCRRRRCCAYLFHHELIIIICYIIIVFSRIVCARVYLLDFLLYPTNYRLSIYILYRSYKTNWRFRQKITIIISSIYIYYIGILHADTAISAGRARAFCFQRYLSKRVCIVVTNRFTQDPRVNRENRMMAE